jgi:PAS domain-containing protein
MHVPGVRRSTARHPGRRGKQATDYEEADERQVTLLMSELWRIVKQQQAEDALRRSEAMLSSIFRAAPVGIGVVNGRSLQYVNDRFCRITGYSREELLSQERVGCI